MKKFLTEERFARAPGYPEERPPTREEVWERNHFLYFDLKPHSAARGCTDKCRRPVRNAPDELVAYCKARFIEAYVWWFNRRDWRKPPDWQEGEPVIARGVPKEVFQSGEVGTWTREIYRCLSVTHPVRSAA